MKVNTSNINSINDIKHLQISDMNIPEGYTNEYTFQCCACEHYKHPYNMYSYDWCKACYKYWLRCQFEGKRFTPWKEKRHLFE